MTDTTVTPDTTPGGRGVLTARLGDLQRRAPVLQIVALVVLFVYGSIDIEGFSQWPNVKSMLTLAALLALAALGQTLVMILGGLDLSVPGFIVMGAIGVSQLYGADGWPAIGAILVPVLVGAVLGALAGWICHTFRIQPLIVTLGIGGVAAGASVAWTKGELTGTAPTFLTTLTSPAETTFGIDIPPIVAITVLVAIVAAVIMHRTRSGRRMYATGANPVAANLTRINTRTIWISVFALSAICSVLVGILLAGFSGADQSLGDPYLFQGLTAVIVGGTTIMGARGDYIHTVIGALILTVLTTILVGNDVDSATQQIIFGLLILAVVAGYGRDRRLRDRI
ncbi:ABC transporter permease [Capillimicrobium parvum]|uniref:Inner membrane ABC transporter permease protein YjfF n=1 Tax=Capillimicrobium parvum TaxID=2884022 RepID=A0A9E6XW71_9ACTN|nr:ABC transporter permease [Capillimicrobium parvum]UGS35597.1 Inner membrane ABC transporter permease protein YjfF [Capillimicrobium parvum]